MRELTLKIQSGGRVEVQAIGNYVRLDALAPDVTIEVPDNGYRVTLQGGDAVRFGQPFERLAITHSEATEQTVTLTVGDGELMSAQLSGDVSVTNTVSTQVLNRVDNKPAPATSVVNYFDKLLPAGGTDIVIGSNSQRKSVTVMAVSGNTSPIRVGGSSSVGVNNGLELQPGQSATFDTTAAIYAYAPAASHYVAYIEEVY